MSTRHEADCATREHIGQVDLVEKIYETNETTKQKYYVTDKIYVNTRTGRTMYDRSEFRSLLN